MIKLKRIPILVGMFLLPAISVQAQEASSLIDHVKRLEKQLSTLERQVYKGSVNAAQTASSSVPSAPSVFAKPGMDLSPSSSQIQTLEQEVQRVTGMVEDLSLKVNQQQRDYEAFKRDMEFRFTELEKKNAVKPQQSPDKNLKGKAENIEEPAVLEKKTEAASQTSEKIPSPKKEAEEVLATSTTAGAMGAEAALELPPSKPEKAGELQNLPAKEVAEMYAVGMELLKEKNYPAARKAFEGFMQNHPEDSLAGQAQYWIGESYIVEADYKKASVAFLKAYRDFPKNAKRPDSLLKLAESLNQLQKNKEACATLEKLLTDFPSANQGIKSLAAKNKAGWGC